MHQAIQSGGHKIFFSLIRYQDDSDIFRTMTPDISYIVPVYNADSYLEDCVDSLLGQHGPFRREIILVEDGSSDNSPDICARYAREHACVRTIAPGHGGLSVARNHGVAAATGRYITFVDADDMVAPDFERLTLDAAKQHDCDIVLCRVCHDSIPQYNIKDSCHVLTATEALSYILYQRRGMTNSACGRIFSRSLIKDIHFMPGRWYEDLEWTPRAFIATHRMVAILDSTLYFYRDNPTSFINSPSPGRLDALYMVDRLLDTLRCHGDRRLIAAGRERRFSAHFNIFRLFGSDINIQRRCWHVIRAERMHSLLTRHVRLKSRLGALISLTGFSITRRLVSHD